MSINKNLILFLITILILIQTASATVLSDCSATAITTPGYYELNQSVTTTNTCFTLSTGDIELDCKGNTITYASTGTASRFGIDVYLGSVQISNVTIRNCNLIKPSVLNTAGYGIRMQRTSDSYIINNTIKTNGTTNNYGIYILTDSNNNLIENNTVEAEGTSSGNIGIYIYGESKNNTVRGNYASGKGTASNHAFNLAYADNNLIENNTFFSTHNHTTTHYGYTAYIRLSSENNTFQDNYLSGLSNRDINVQIYVAENSHRNRIYRNIIESNRSSTASNYGIQVLGSDWNIVENNWVVTSGTTTNYGIVLSASTANTLVNNNTVYPGGTTTTNHGIVLSSATTNNVTNNFISTTGTTTNNGVYVSASQNNLVESNIIYTSCITGTTSNCYGIHLNAADNNTLRENNISTSGVGSSNSGIYAIYSSYNTLDENYIIANGSTSGNNGINLYISSNYNTVSNNTLFTDGTLNNYGIQIYSSNRNKASSNQIFTSGSSTTNYGIYLVAGADRNNVSQNNISTYGTTSNFGIYLLNSVENNVLENFILANGSTRGVTTTTSNYGIILSTNCYNNLLENNTLQTDGGRYNYGIHLLTNSNENIINYNKIYPGGVGGLNAGVYITEGRTNLIEGNLISTNGSSANYGLYFLSNSRYNIIKENNISTFGSTDSYGVLLDSSTPNFPHNNTFQGNNFISVAGTEFRTADALIDNLTLINQNINSYYFTGTGSLVTVKNSTSGEIKFLERLSGSGTGLSDKIYLTDNYAFVDSSVTALNKPAEVTIYNRPTERTNLGIYKDGVLCSSDICKNLTSMQAGNVTFNVTGWSYYSINASDEISHTINLISPENNTNITTQDYNFTFRVTDETSSIFSCSIFIDEILSSSNESVSNNTETTLSISGISGGIHEWYVSCSDESNWSQSSETRTIQNSIPSIVYNSPENSSFIQNTNSVLLNFTLSDTEATTFDIWIYGDDVLIDSSEDVAEGDSSYLWTDLSLGEHNWSIIASDGFSNSTQEYYYFNLINLTINCEAGGPYLENPTVLIQGTISDNSGIVSLSSQTINISIYNNSNGELVTSSNSTTQSGGIFNSLFTGLEVGNYTAYATINYSEIIINASTTFRIALGYESGYLAGFIAGNESGYISGFNEGNITGFNLGNITGFILGNTTGFTLGNESGFLEGYSLGNTTGFILGNESGYILGNATGFTLGNTTGFILGNESGFILGNLTGFELGNATGFTLGNTTGFILGNLTGFNFGNQTGYETGYGEGFIAGRNGSASLILDKTASFHNLTNETVTYNITLRITNNGRGNSTSTNITDSDSDSSPYNLGNIETGNSITRSYLKTYSRNSTIYNSTLSIASVSGIDSLLSTEIQVNSTEIILVIPSTETGQQLSLIKNTYFNSENGTEVNYTISIELINSGGEDLTGITLIDSDLDLVETIDLNRTQSYNYSSSTIIEKEASNLEKTFAKSSATINFLTYLSNQIKILIPGYGGPADTIVYAPASVNNSTSFNSLIEIINQNQDIGQNFVVDYWITNNDETINYSSGQQTIYVSALGSTNLTATLTSPTASGIYKLRALTSYIGGPDFAFASFEVLVPPAEIPSTPATPTTPVSSGGGGSITGKVTEEIVCPSPYMRYGKECCLDSNNNSVCDRDESIEPSEDNKSPSNEETSEKPSEFYKKIKEISQDVSEFFSQTGKSISKNKIYLISGLEILALAILVIFSSVILIKKIKKRKPKNVSRLKNIVGKEVYTSNGNRIGKVVGIYLEKNKIYGWLIKPNKKAVKNLRKKKILVKHKDILSIGKIMILAENVEEHLDKIEIPKTD